MMLDGCAFSFIFFGDVRRTDARISHTLTGSSPPSLFPPFLPAFF
jgi:hypothetical protein